jgi:inner membrane protein
MTGKTHQIIGLTCGLGYYLLRTNPAYHPATLAMVTVFSSIGALLPDIDNPAAKIWDTLPFGHVAGELVNPFLQHRNLSHSFLGLGLVGLLGYRIFFSMPVYWGVSGQAVLFAFLAAYLSHMVADMVTVEGIPLFFPHQHMYGIPPRPLQGIRIETGKWFENIIVFPLVNLALVSLAVSHWAEIKLILFK